MRSCGVALEGYPGSSLESEMGPSSMQGVSGVDVGLRKVDKM